jgi:transposase-like protein
MNTECPDMPTVKRNLSKKAPKKLPQAAAAEDMEIVVDHDKSKVECLCPKCGKKHIMNFHWIGRGTPRKYCQSCRDSI